MWPYHQTICYQTVIRSSIIVCPTHKLSLQWVQTSSHKPVLWSWVVLKFQFLIFSLNISQFCLLMDSVCTSLVMVGDAVLPSKISQNLRCCCFLSFAISALVFSFKISQSLRCCCFLASAIAASASAKHWRSSLLLFDCKTSMPCEE